MWIGIYDMTPRIDGTCHLTSETASLYLPLPRGWMQKTQTMSLWPQLWSISGSKVQTDWVCKNFAMPCGEQWSFMLSCHFPSKLIDLGLSMETLVSKDITACMEHNAHPKAGDVLSRLVSILICCSDSLELWLIPCGVRYHARWFRGDTVDTKQSQDPVEYQCIKWVAPGQDH